MSQDDMFIQYFTCDYSLFFPMAKPNVGLHFICDIFGKGLLSVYARIKIQKIQRKKKGKKSILFTFLPFIPVLFRSFSLLFFVFFLFFLEFFTLQFLQTSVPMVGCIVLYVSFAVAICYCWA